MRYTRKIEKGKLLVYAGDRSFEVHLKLKRTLVGRGMSCEIRLGDEGASREHCAIEQDAKGYRLKDLGSHNGTLVNGRRVRDHALNWGDAINIGGTRLVFVRESEKLQEEIPVTRRKAQKSETISLSIRKLRPELVRTTPEVAEYLQALFEMGGLLARPADEESLLTKIRALILRRFRLVNCAILLADPDKGTVSLTIPSEPPAFDAEELSAAVIEAEARLVRTEGAPDAIYAPIMGTGRVMGVIAADNSGTRGAFAESQLNAFGVAGHQVGLALENYRYVRGLELEREGERAGSKLVGASADLERIRTMIGRVSRSDATVLIRGESGVGKEVVARGIHASSGRAKGPFVALNCAAVVEGVAESELFGHERGAFTGATASRAGLFEAAEGGTIFLDEIAELSPAIQAKLLRVLENRNFLRVGGRRERTTNARVIAATNQDLKTAVEEGRFREDLYYRLNVMEIVISPLRDRPEDIEVLARHFLKTEGLRVNPKITAISKSAMGALRKRTWPGNVRELRNVLERAMMLATGETIEEEDFGPADSTQIGLDLDRVERKHIMRVLRMAGGNKSEAARILGINRSTLYEKLKAYGVE